MKKSLIFALPVLFLALSFSPLFAREPVLVVKLKKGKKIPELNSSMQVQNLFESTFIISGKNIQDLKLKFLNSNAFEYVELSQQSEKRSLGKKEKTVFIKDNTNIEFNDPMATQVWSFRDAEQFGISVNKAYQAHKSPYTEKIIVAVIDTGVDYNHEDLKEVLWKNPNEIPNNGIDDDQNGYIDDIYGINTLIRDSHGKATVDIMDTHSHGTHVSGTIAAKQNNSIGIAGIASNVKIMAIRTVPNDGDELDVDVAEAFIYAARNGARIINCSFGKYNNEGQKLIPDTLKYIADKYGVLVVVAAGNDGANIDARPTFPASFPNDNLLVIASTSAYGNLSYFSNYGAKNVDVAAPGSVIYSTVPGNKYESMSGTSMAAPTTVGVAAEILSHYPNLSYLSLKDILIKSVTKMDKFKNQMVSEGRIDLLKALDLARSQF